MLALIFLTYAALDSKWIFNLSKNCALNILNYSILSTHSALWR